MHVCSLFVYASLLFYVCILGLFFLAGTTAQQWTMSMHAIDVIHLDTFNIVSSILYSNAVLCSHCKWGNRMTCTATERQRNVNNLLWKRKHFKTENERTDRKSMISINSCCLLLSLFFFCGLIHVIITSNCQPIIPFPSMTPLTEWTRVNQCVVIVKL